MISLNLTATNTESIILKDYLESNVSCTWCISFCNKRSIVPCTFLSFNGE